MKMKKDYRMIRIGATFLSALILTVVMDDSPIFRWDVFDVRFVCTLLAILLILYSANSRYANEKEVRS